jgi:hypothetical protein
MTRQERKQAVADLRALAADFDAAAARAYTLADEDQRRYDARQLRMVAVLVAAFRPKGAMTDRGFADLWLSAGRKMLAYYDAADMDAVHASRASRRDVTGTER